LTKKLISDDYVHKIEIDTKSIFPLRDITIKKVKVLKKAKLDGIFYIFYLNYGYLFFFLYKIKKKPLNSQNYTHMIKKEKKLLEEMVLLKILMLKIYSNNNNND
jgi:hypothetical protein